MPERLLRPLHAVSIRCFEQKFLQVFYKMGHLEEFIVLPGNIPRHEFVVNPVKWCSGGEEMKD